MFAYFAGEFCNSYVLAKMKLLTEGRSLWMRTIGSTIVGEAVDSAIFYPAAFLGAWPTEHGVERDGSRTTRSRSDGRSS